MRDFESPTLFIVSGHQIDPLLVAEVEKLSKEFFGCSLNDRRKIAENDKKLLHIGNAFSDQTGFQMFGVGNLILSLNYTSGKKTCLVRVTVKYSKNIISN